MSSRELRLPWARRARAYLALARISNSPTVASNVLAGAAIAGATGLSGATGALVLALIAFYTAGMYLNDYLDYEIDRRERPERPLPSGLVPRGAALGITVLLFALGLLLLWPLVQAAVLGGVLLIALIVAYDAWHKTNPLSPLVMALTRVMVYVIAFLAFSTQLSGALAAWAVLLGLYIVGLTYIAKTESLPSLTRYWPSVILFLPAVFLALRAPGVLGWVLLAAFAGWVVYALRFVYARDRRSVGKAIASLIAGVSLLDALVLVDAGALTLVPLALLAFVLTLFLQRYIKGT